MLDARIVKRRAALVVDVALTVERGAACALFGASGAGKSTVLACIAGAEMPDDGYVKLDGELIFPPALELHRRSIGYLTQEPNLFPHLTVEGNVRFGVSGSERAGAREDAWIDELRERFGLTPIWGQRADRISGGQARRVAFARMLARKPSLVLLDEPFAGLDRHLVRELLATIAEWHARFGFTLIVVDHDAEILERLCPRALVVEDGRVVQSGTWAELRASPATALLEQLLAPL